MSTCRAACFAIAPFPKRAASLPSRLASGDAIAAVTADYNLLSAIFEKCIDTSSYMEPSTLYCSDWNRKKHSDASKDAIYILELYANFYLKRKLRMMHMPMTSQKGGTQYMLSNPFKNSCFTQCTSLSKHGSHIVHNQRTDAKTEHSHRTQLSMWGVLHACVGAHTRRLKPSAQISALSCHNQT